MSWMGIEHTIPASERAKIRVVDALDRAASMIGYGMYISPT
jgi:hypothetical protein